MKKVILVVMLISTLFLFAQQFDKLKFSDPLKYGWKNHDLRMKARTDLLNRQKLLQIYQLNKQSKTKNMIKSMVFPGWGHFSAQRYTKGQVLLGLEIVMFGSSLYYYDQAREYYNKYKDENYIIDMNSYYEDTKLPLHLSQAFFALGVVVWIYSLYDTGLVTDDYNKDLWDNLMKEFHERKFEISPQGITLRF